MPNAASWRSRPEALRLRDHVISSQEASSKGSAVVSAQTSFVHATFLTGGGEAGDLMRAHDWAATPLGPPRAGHNL
jgi:hypothetical protein